MQENIQAEATMVETMKYIVDRSQNISRYSDKLSKSIDRISEYFKKVAPISGLRFFSLDPFFEDDKNEYNRYYYLCITNFLDREWKLCVATFDSLDDDAQWTRLRDPYSESRIIKKEIIKALPQFMLDYAEKLKEVEKEYESISEKAEKIAKILEE